MFQHLTVPMKYFLRIIILAIVIILLADVVITTVRGIMVSVHAYGEVISNTTEKPLLPALEAVDLFMLALVVLLLALGLVKLFLSDMPFISNFDLPWLKVGDIHDIKALLWNAMLLTLMVLFCIRMFNTDQLGWTDLVLPGAVFLLALSGKFMKDNH